MPPISPEPLGLGIFIPSSPSSPPPPSSSGARALLSPPPFITPSRQLRRSRVHTASPRSLGTRGGFRSIPDKLPGSIYRGEENPFAPYPDEEVEGREERINREYDEAVLSTELDEGLEDHLDPGEEIGRLDGNYMAHRQPTYFDPSSSAISTPKIIVGRLRRRNLASTPGADPSNTEYNLGPGPGLASPGGVHSPRIPDVSTPSTPTLPVASPSPGTEAPGTPSLGFGRLASALAEDIAPVPNPLFVASVALSVVVGLLIVGIVSCSVAYCRRNKKKKRGETGEEKGPSSPKRSILGGESTRKLFMRSSDTLTSLSPSSNMSLLTSGGSRPPSILKSPLDTTVDIEEQGKVGKAGSRISFMESNQAGLVLTAAVDMQKQLYTPPPWQPERSSPLARPPINPPAQSSDSTPALLPSRLSICAIPPLEAIQEEEHVTASGITAQMPSGVNDKDSEEGSYHSCSDNSSMTTHASDDIFALAPSSEDHDDISSSVPIESIPERPISRASYRRNSLESIASLSLDYLSRTSIDSPTFRESTPEGDTSFDTLSSASPRTPRASTSEPNFIAYLDSPLGLDLDLSLSDQLNDSDKKDEGRRKTMGVYTTLASPTHVRSGKIRRQVSLRWLDEETQTPSEEGPRKVLFADTAPSPGVRQSRPSSGYIPRDPSYSEMVKRSRSLPHKPPPVAHILLAENRKSVFRRAFKALSVIAKEPDPVVSGATPPRPSRRRSTLRGDEYDDQRQSLKYGSPRPHRDGAEYDLRERSRFSTASWDELGCGEGFDAYYLGYDTATNRSDPRQEEEEEEEEGEEAQQDEEDLEINDARISFGFLSSDIGHSECAFELESYPFPEPASHLPHIRITSH